MLVVRVIALAGACAFFWSGVQITEVVYRDRIAKRLSWVVLIVAVLLALACFFLGVLCLFYVIAPRELVDAG